MPKRIDEMFAFVVIDENGDEGVPAMISGGTAFPLIAADEARLESLRPIAAKMATMLGQPFTLCRFSVRTEIEVITP